MAQSGSGSEIGEVGGGGTELIPEQRWGVARQAHGAGFPKDSAVGAFSAAVLSQGIGGSNNMVNAE